MNHAHATIVVGLAYGDCGKGTIVDHLCRTRDVHTVVRFNGGPQAGHNVITHDRQHHTFSQFGSGTFAGKNIATLLSRFMLIEPYAMLNEAAHLQQLGCKNVWDRLLIDGQCVVITPAHQAANRLWELSRGTTAHGSCGMGVGEAAADAIRNPLHVLRVSDFLNPRLVREKLWSVVHQKSHQLQAVLMADAQSPTGHQDAQTLLNPNWIDVAVDAYRAVASAARIISTEDSSAIINQPGGIVFEGAQGALLDEDYGFHPHTTWSRTTTANAMTLLRESGLKDPPQRIGVLRSYITRHGAGPLVTEDEKLKIVLSEPHNRDGGHQGRFRVGVFDAVAARYAILVAGVDEIALTHLDRLNVLPKHICSAYRRDSDPFEIRAIDPANLSQREIQTRAIEHCRPVFSDCIGSGPDSFVDQLQRQLGLPVRITSSGTSVDAVAVRK